MSLYGTPGIGGSIDDLTIDINDLNRDVKAQKGNFIETMHESDDRNSLRQDHIVR